MKNNLHPAPKVRKNFLGGISAMTEYRWWQRGFPRPKKVNGRNYYTTEQVEIEIPKWIENGGVADDDVTVYRIIPNKEGNVPSAFELRQKLKRQTFNKVENVEVSYVGNWRHLKLSEHTEE